MKARGDAHLATEVARSYAGLVRGFVLDRRDAGEAAAIKTMGVQVSLADTLAPLPARAILALAVLRFGLTDDRLQVAAD